MIKLPDHIEAQMKLYREGLVPLPEDFIEFHSLCAEADLNLRLRHKIWVLLEDRALQYDGWGDGMKVRHVVIAENTLREHKVHGNWVTRTLKWHTSGAWFEESAGWSRFVDMYDDTPRTARLAMPVKLSKS